MYYIYIMSNRWRTTIYIGITNDLHRRVEEHRRGEGGAFTKKYRLGDLIFVEEYVDVSDALLRENELKGWSRPKKNKLIPAANPTWKDLSQSLI